MKISGFTFSRNGQKLYYPIKESIESMLPLVDEFIVALGDSDDDDKSLEEIESINSNKVKIIRTKWDLMKYPRGMEHAHQTDIAKNACTGDWVFYLQADELCHEKDHEAIFNRCEELNNDKEVEGLLFDYYHFWGDYNHCHNSHAWYRKEIRIVRNDPEIHSWESAQSFRRIPDFDGINYRQQEGTYKLKVAQVNAHIYHYGWVRPPQLMQTKRKYIDTNHKGAEKVSVLYSSEPDYFDYGNMSKVPIFQGTHPKVMQKRMDNFFWQEQLNYKNTRNAKKFKHDKLKMRILSFLENHITKKQIFGFRNYIKIK
ncbi:MAG: hypothetical protein A2X64_00555 [Ignavibacteria bacterium GWF2_33_9]|nr:MAG: hypothetical protein A2X64_00555 [Ignavibacteria bacterium GWF2_33_9]